MSTTDQFDDTTRQPADEVERRRQRRLELSLLRRDRLARIAVERMSHDLKDSNVYLVEQLQVEQSIQHCWPDVYERQFEAWILDDVSRMHTPDRPTQDCGICAAFQAASSVDKPDAWPRWDEAA